MQYKKNLVKQGIKLQEKAIRVINFKDSYNQVSKLFPQNKISKFEHFVHYQIVKNSCQEILSRKIVLSHLMISSFKYKKFINIIPEMY